MTPHAARFSASGRPEGVGMWHTACPTVLCFCLPPPLWRTLQYAPKTSYGQARLTMPMQATGRRTARTPASQGAHPIGGGAGAGWVAVRATGWTSRLRLLIWHIHVRGMAHHPTVIIASSARMWRRYVQSIRITCVAWLCRGRPATMNPSCAAGKRINLSSYILSEAMP
jgi:hypothetical protein